MAIVVYDNINPFPGNRKVKYYYKLTEKNDLDEFSNSIFVGSYELQLISYIIGGSNLKIITAPVLTTASNIIIDDEIEEGLYLVRIKVFNTNSGSVNISPYFNGNNGFSYSIPPKSIFEIYDIFLKEKGSAYSISLPSGLALIEFSLERIFEKGNRINVPEMINTNGNGTINLKLRKGTYAVKIPYKYSNSSSNSFSNFEFGYISTSLGASVPLIISSISGNSNGSGTFIIYLKTTGDYEDLTFKVNYGSGLGIRFIFGLEIEEINEFVMSTNFLSQSITLSGSQVVQNILNVKGSGTHLRLKYASVSGLTSTVSQCQLQAANLNRNSNYSVVWDFIAGGNSTPPGWEVKEINAIQLVANGGTSAASVNLSLILLYEVIAGELS
jgi:hypothetical protein